jgi:hypothetical protein
MPAEPIDIDRFFLSDPSASGTYCVSLAWTSGRADTSTNLTTITFDCKRNRAGRLFWAVRKPDSRALVLLLGSFLNRTQ